MRFAGMVLLVTGVGGIALEAQSASMRRSNGHSWTTAASDGRTVTVVIHDGSEGADPADKMANIRREYTALISQLDFSRSTVRVHSSGVPYIEFQCKPGRACWNIRRLFPYEDPVGESAFDALQQRDVYCESVAVCQDFLNRVNPQRAAVTVAPAPSVGRQTAQPPAPIDCNALRSTYYPAGQRPALPAECLSDLDRATTYQPVHRPVLTPAPRPAPETVIDGSKIPSRIDFPRPAPAPAAPRPPAPAPPSLSPLPPARPSPASDMYRDFLEQTPIRPESRRPFVQVPAPRSNVSPLTPALPAPEAQGAIERFVSWAVDGILDWLDLTPADRVYHPVNMLRGPGKYDAGVGRMSSVQIDQILINK